jgi:hypothetical protein
MKKQLLFLSIFLLFVELCSYCQKQTDSILKAKYLPYLQFMDYLYDENYLDYIKPNKKYGYWEANMFYQNKFSNVFRSKENPNISDTILLAKSSYGVTHSCPPVGDCYWYISTKTKKDNKTVTINTQKQFYDFIGSIDNVYEALLILFQSDYTLISKHIPSNQIKFKAIDRGYLITISKLLSHCPIKEGYATYYVDVNKNITLIKTKVTKTSKICI